MADIRTLKLALLADTKQFVDGLDKADKETKNFSNKLGDALNKFGCFRLAARIADLRNDGMNIKTTIVKLKNKKQVAQYSI